MMVKLKIGRARMRAAVIKHLTRLSSREREKERGRRTGRQAKSRTLCPEEGNTAKPPFHITPDEDPEGLCT